MFNKTLYSLSCKLYFLWKRLKTDLIRLHHDHRGDVDVASFAQDAIDSFARYLLPIIQDFFASEEGRLQFQKWKERQNQKPSSGLSV